MLSYLASLHGTRSILDMVHVPDMEPFVYTPLCLTAVLSDWLGSPDLPGLPTELLTRLRSYDVADPVDTATAVLAALRNDLAGLGIDRVRCVYTHEVIRTFNGVDYDYSVHITQMPDEYRQPSDYEARRNVAASLLERALTMYMDTHLLDDPTEAFQDFVARRR